MGGVVEDLLQAKDDKGQPDWPRRTRGAELALKYQAQLELDGEEGDLLPEGAFIVLPRPVADRE